MSGTIRYGEDGAIDPEDSATPVAEGEDAPGYHEEGEGLADPTAMTETIDTSGTSGTTDDAADASPQVFERADEGQVAPEGTAQAPEIDPEAEGEDALEPDYEAQQVEQAERREQAEQQQAEQRHPEYGTFDPSAHGVDDVNAYLDQVDEDEQQRVLEAEEAGKARKGILEA